MDSSTSPEEELADGVRLALSATHNLAEGAGAAPLAATRKPAAGLRGKTFVCVMSGGNVDTATLSRILGGGIAGQGAVIDTGPRAALLEVLPGGNERY